MLYKFLLLTSSDKFGYIITLSIFGINILLHFFIIFPKEGKQNYYIILEFQSSTVFNK